MKNADLMKLAVNYEGAADLNHKQLRDKLVNECYVIWELPEFRNFHIPATPVSIEQTISYEPTLKSLYASILSVHLKMRLWPVVYEGENDGYLIRHVCPIVKERNSVSSQGSQNDFFPHVDNPDLKIAGEPDTHELAPSPDTLTLFSLRNSENVYTSLIRLDDVLEKLSDKSLDLLQKPLFTVRRPDSFN